MTFSKLYSHWKFSTLLSKYYQIFFTLSRKTTDKRKNLQLFVDAPADYHSSLAHGSVFKIAQGDQSNQPIFTAETATVHAVNVWCIL